LGQQVNTCHETSLRRAGGEPNVRALQRDPAPSLNHRTDRSTVAIRTHSTEAFL
jgi:hypothetical protein